MHKYVKDLQNMGIFMTLNEDASLNIRAAKGVMTEAILETLKSHKEKIIAYLQYGVGKEYSLSYAQERLWFLDRFEEGKSNAYHMPSLLRLKGKIEYSALKQTLDTILKRHEVLRSQYIQKEEALCVRIGAIEAFELETVACKEEVLQKEVAILLEQPFDLEKDMLFKAVLFTIDTEVHYLFINMHHIVSDGWSIGVMIQEFVQLYTAYTQEEKNPLPSLEIQYGDYASWQKSTFTASVVEEKLAYWTEHLEGHAPLVLPTTYPRPSVQSNKGNRCFFHIPKKLTEGLYEISKNHDATLFMTLLSSFSLLLHKYSQQDSFVIGSPIANRNRIETEPLIGFFVNTLALKQDFKKEMTFRTLLEQTKRDTLNAYSYQDLPFEKIVEALHIQRDASRSPLFQVMFILQNHNNQVITLRNMSIENVTLDNPTSKFDITMELKEVNGALEGSLEYATDLFDVDYIEAMLGHFTILLEAICKDENKLLSHYNLLSKEEEKNLLLEYNNTQVAYDKTLCIHQHFEAQVSVNPEHIAVVYEDEALSYQALNEKSNQLAHYLIAQGIKVEDLVGICMTRSLDMLIGILAILKAGAAYIPIDPTYPKERIAYMLEETQADCILSHSPVQDIVSQTECKVHCVDSLDLSHLAKANPSVFVRANHLAYVIYTSGSTGRPKGVMIEHRNTTALIAWAKHSFDRDVFAHTLASTSFTFDLSVFEMFVPLSMGTTLYIVPNALVLVEAKDRYPITCINTVPSVIRELHTHDAITLSVKHVFLAGEKLNQTLVDSLYSHPQIEDIYDLYGPSEDTTYTTYTRRTLGGIENIGRPIDNTQLYILDKSLTPMPKGVWGELHIAGDGLARGYLHQSSLTQEKFITNPFEEGSKLYKTGDLVRYLEEGMIEYGGRIDEQVKIRGFRIELGEIEQQLLQVKGVKSCVVLAKEEKGQVYLVAYITRLTHKEIKSNNLKYFLSEKLPSYMVPSVFKQLDKMPFLPNGKIDKKALLNQDIHRVSTQKYVAPKDEMQEALVKIFETVLKIENVGIEDNFFDLGGDSLMIMQVVSLAKKAGIPMAVKDLFMAQTITDLSTLIQEADVIEAPIVIEKEAFLEADIVPIGSPVQKEDSQKILLTGATGFLGVYLLADLLKQGKCIVYCLMRCESVSEGTSRLRALLKSFGLWEEEYSKTMKVIPGDLAQVQLGMNRSHYERLAQEVSTVYHSATHMNTLADYETLKQVNVMGLKEILKFTCIAQQKRLEYISTADIFTYETQSIADENTLLSAQLHYPSKGYASSKFISENILLEAQKRGFNINIYRIGLITGDTKIGKNEETQWLYPLLKGIGEVQCMIDMPNFELSMSPVDFVAEAIVALAKQQNHNDVFHINSPFLLKFMDIVKLEGLEVVDLYTFLQRLKAYNSTHEQEAYFSPYFEDMFAYSEDICKKIEQSYDITQLPIFSVASVKTFVRSWQTRERLKALDVYFPEINEALIHQYFRQK